MPREAELSNIEKDFIREALKEQLRLDGRSFTDYRPIELTFGEEYGFVDLKLGKTKVAVRISCEVTPPYPERKFDGIFHVSCEFSPMASPAYEVGKQNIDEVILARILDKSIRRSSALDTESLCIVAGAKCFTLRADIHILDHDGNLIDASCLALMAALRHFRRPDVTVDGDSITLHSLRDRDPVPLSIIHHPLCVTVSYFGDGHYAIMDANQAEEHVRDGFCVITLNKHGELCQMAKYGGTPADAFAMINWTNQALVQVQQMDAFLKEKLDEDARKRDAGGLMAELRAENDR